MIGQQMCKEEDQMLISIEDSSRVGSQQEILNGVE